ncbi:hypothetical protein LCGC14_0994490 [marine sediment metagenome]|uniref:Uncharacterized protein n=1 Tax=marine sediment metagenome TaxID=412755 RepID=A0A0F9RB50_9ZZZZ
MIADDESPAYKILYLVWEECNNSSIWSYRRLNRSMHDAVTLAIDSGMKFKQTDFDTFSSKFRLGYWGSWEQFYSQAVSSNNLSACHALEHSLRRKPWIVLFQINLLDSYRQGGRIARGSRFYWDGKYVTVTSMGKDELVACSYHTSSIEDRQIAKEVMNRLGDVSSDTKTVDNPAKKYRLTRLDLRPPKRRLNEQG